MYVTLAGIVTDLRDEQLRNASFSINLTLSGILTLESDAQLLNA